MGNAPTPTTGIGLSDIFKMNPNVLVARLSQSNPAIRQLVDSVSGMTPEQAFASRGLDYRQAQQMFRDRFGINI